MPRIAAKNWQNAYLTEARQPGGVMGAGRWTAGQINPAAQARERNAEAIARHDALVSGGKKPGEWPVDPHSKPGKPPDPNQGEREHAHDLLQQAARIETEIKSLERQLKSLNQRIGAAAGATTSSGNRNTQAVNQATKPGSAAGSSTSSSSSVSALRSQRASIRARIAKLRQQRTDLLHRAAVILRGLRKNAPSPTMKGNRVAVISPEATKAATLTGDGELTFVSFPITKVEETPDGDVVVIGKASDGSVDSDDQIVDPEWAQKGPGGLMDWLNTAGNVRVQHQAQRDPAGKGLTVDFSSDSSFVRSLVVEPVAKELVRKGVLTAYSVGIARPEIVRDPVARGGRIKGGQIVEISLVDRPANKNCGIQLVKNDDGGQPEFTGKVFGADVLTKEAKPAKSDTVTVELPRNMSLSVKPSDLAKLATFRQKLAVEEGAAKAAVPAPGSPEAKYQEASNELHYAEENALKAVMAAEAAVYKRDIDTATRQRLASAGHALADGSYPVENVEDLGNAAILARSKHGKWKAAAKLIARRARELGVPNPMKKDKVAKAVEPEVTKCGPCGGSGMVNGEPCGSCKKGAKKAKRMAKKAQAKAAKAVRAALEPDVVKKKRVMCSSCGARQNRKHEMCSECGTHLGSAIPVMKNHAFTCLSCGKDLDKGEKHCPQCGKENPGYLPEADHQIPANMEAEKAAKAKAKAKKKAGRKNPFGDKQAPPFGKDKDEDSSDDASEKAARVTKGKKGKRPTPGSAGGVPGNQEKPAGRHREPDGAEVEAFEADASMEDGDDEKPTHLEAPTLKSADPEMAASLTLTALGVPQHLGALHALTCPAFDLGDVAKSFPHASFAGIDLAEWQAGALSKAASAPLEEAEKALAIWKGAATLKAADPHLVGDLRAEAHKMFTDANPGPSHFPTPVELSPHRFNRPLITEGHEAASPGHKPPNDAKVPGVGGINAEDYTRGYLTEGTAADAPENMHPTPPMPPPDHTGVPTQAPARQYYTNSAREASRHALQVMHDHIAVNHPDICPMHGAEDIGRHPVPTPAGVPTQAAAGEARKAAKKAKAAARKAAKAKARKQRKAAVAKRRKLERKVLKGQLTVDEARQKLGLGEVVTKAATVEAPPALDTDALKAAVAEATAPLAAALSRAYKAQKRQDKVIRKQGKALDSIAAQPDTSQAPFRGVALTKQASAAPAGPLTVADSVEQAKATRMRLLEWDAHNNADPGQREASRAALMKELDVPMNSNPYSPMRT